MHLLVALGGNKIVGKEIFYVRSFGKVGSSFVGGGESQL